MKKAREIGDMATYQRLAQESKRLGQASEQNAPEFSQYTQKQAEAGKTGNVGDYLGRGIKSGLEVGSYLLPSAKALGITSVGGKAGIDSLGGAMRGYGSSGYGEGTKGALMGTAVGGGLSLLGSGLKGLSKQADKTGEKVITKVFKKNQTNTFKEKTGEEMGEFMNRHKNIFKGDYFDDSIKLSEKFQNDFDELARRSGVKIKDTQLKKVFQSEIERLRATGLSKNISTANKLEKELQGILVTLGKNFDISDLTQARVEADKLATFNNTKGVRNLYNTVRNLEQKTVQNAVKDKTINGRNLEEIGKELNKIYLFKDMARNIQSSNAGGKLLSPTTILAGGGGAAAGGVPGLIAGVAINQALSSPGGTRLTSNVLQNVAKPVLNVAGEAIGSNLARQALIGGLSVPESSEGGVTPQITPFSAPQTQETLDTGNLPTPKPQEQEPILSPGGQWQWSAEQNDWIPYEAKTETEEQLPATLTGYSPEQLYGAALKAYQAGDSSSYKQLISMYEDETKYQKEQGKKEKGATLTAGQKKELSDFEVSIKQMNSLNTSIDQFKDVMGPVKGRIRAMIPYDVEAQAFNSNMKAIAQVVGKAMEGGVLRKEDEIKYQKMLPQITDKPEVAKRKIQNVIEMLRLQKQTKEDMYSGSENMGDIYSPVIEEE